jgi:molybdate transport system substrate-binding protein
VRERKKQLQNNRRRRNAMNASARTALAAGFAIIAAVAAAGTVRADDIKVLSTIGVKPALPELVAEFERGSGHKISIVWGNAATLKSRYLEGEQADVAVLTAAAIDDLLKAGKVVGRVDLARSGMGIGVKAGAPKPDISSPETFKRTLLAAKSIAYSSQGASGIYFVTLIERLGIAAEVKAKHKDTAGAVGELLATGEAEIGIQQIPELAAVPGVEVVGPFPGELQVITVFSAALDTKAKDNEAAKAFVKFISAPAAAAAYKAKGLDPT